MNISGKTLIFIDNCIYPTLIYLSELDPDIRDSNQRSPLHCAAFGGYINCMNLLLENKASVDLQDKEVSFLE